MSRQPQPAAWPTISWRQLHTWGGLLLGWLLLPVFVTGTLAVFEHELSRWMQPEIPSRPEVSRAEALDRAVAFLQQQAPTAQGWMVSWPSARDPALSASWGAGRAMAQAYLDPRDGQPLRVRDTLGGHLFVDFHYELLAGKVGLWLVGVAGLAMVIALITGILIHARLFKDFFAFRPAAGGHKAWLDGHNLSGVLTLPFLLMITYSGVSLSFTTLYPATTNQLFAGNGGKLRSAVVRDFSRPPTGEAAPLLLPLSRYLPLADARFGEGNSSLLRVVRPGDAHAHVEVMRSAEDQLALIARRLAFDGVSGQPLDEQFDFRPLTVAFRAMAGLHVGHYGGLALSWLYFICGAAGCLLIASGLVLYPLKRRQRHGPSRWLTSVDALNQISIAGSLQACALVLWANRLLPLELSARPQWEVALLCSGWLLSALLICWPRAGWRAQLGLAGLLWLLLPAVDLLSVSSHWWAAWAAGERVFVVVDLLALALGLALLLMAGRRRREQ